MGDAGPPSAGSPRRQCREVGQRATGHRMLVSAVCAFALTTSQTAPAFPLPPLVNASSTGYYFSIDIHTFSLSKQRSNLLNKERKTQNSFCTGGNTNTIREIVDNVSL